ncbi:Uma2 family endonuclease [Aureimonas sp. ME7]|uniref:Uma2 family endonuclease n=1 Tax=Aureimonas sp. ME7 TaxID=2744252 RepID=UPI0015F43482|nr:Uma2 family endonuclease [Aureimonas sp. ME7]
MPLGPRSLAPQDGPIAFGQLEGDARRMLELAGQGGQDVKVPEPSKVSADEFLHWVFDQDGHFELVDGFVVEMMAGAKQAHNVVVSNIVISIGPQAKRDGCRTTSSDTAVRTGADGIRFPDVVVDCGPPDPSALVAARPTLVVEVSSPGTSQVDTTDKLDEYQRHETIRLILFVEPGIVSAKLYRRGEEGVWSAAKYEDLADIVDLPEIESTLRLRDIYDTLAPGHRPRLQLVKGENGGPSSDRR